MRKLIMIQFAATAVLVAAFGMAAFGILLLDFQWPGLFKVWAVPKDRMAGNMALLILFGFQHSVMPRKSVKKWLAMWIPAELERSFYVLLSGFMLLMIAGLWSPTEPPLYDFRNANWGWVLNVLAACGLLLVAWSGAVLGGLDLLGVNAILKLMREKSDASKPLPFSTPGPYKWVRHPIYLGLLIAFWATPAMTHDHLLFAEVMTAYILIGASLEEADLVKRFGEQYIAYQASVPMLIPGLKWFGVKK